MHDPYRVIGVGGGAKNLGETAAKTSSAAPRGAFDYLPTSASGPATRFQTPRDMESMRQEIAADSKAAPSPPRLRRKRAASLSLTLW